MAPFIATREDARLRRRDEVCIGTGLVAGAALGALAGSLAWPSAILLTAVGTLVGGVVGRLLAPRVSADDWDPPANHRSHVGVGSPDDDLAGG